MNTTTKTEDELLDEIIDEAVRTDSSLSQKDRQRLKDAHASYSQSVANMKARQEQEKREHMERTEKAVKSVQKFTLKTTKLCAVDPCYDGPEDGVVIKKCLPGVWEASVTTSDEGGWGKRIATLTAIHEAHNSLDEQAHACWEREPGCVGVDSGQAGIFEASKFKGRDDNEDLYDQICEVTLKNQFGVVKGLGAVSSSGFGDGGYLCESRRNNDNVCVGVRITFIGGEDEESDYDDE